MSVTPGTEPILAAASPPRRNTRARVWTICFAVFAFEIGIFLAVFPWMDSWRLNHFPVLVPSLVNIWEDHYLRGAVTGLGLVNLWISVTQIISLFTRNK